MKTKTQTKQVKVGELFNLLSLIEAEKGKRKLAEANEKQHVAQFVAVANGENVVFVTETEQKVASVGYQTRSNISAEKLLALGVSAETIAAATVESAPFAVFRTH